MDTRGALPAQSQAMVLRFRCTFSSGKKREEEVRDGNECGMSFENYQDIQVGDVIECFEVEEVARSI